ncbi:MAG: hypothetical protein A49_11890 [Methyloceanibacter sp.]|nr:MAG: hypothetical protein A49_11890 [Methyloceanibacter sp.]
MGMSLLLAGSVGMNKGRCMDGEEVLELNESLWRIRHETEWSPEKRLARLRELRNCALECDSLKAYLALFEIVCCEIRLLELDLGGVPAAHPGWAQWLMRRFSSVA